MVNAVVFDFDGVLADSEPLHLAACQDVFASIGITLTRDEYYSRYLGFDDRTLIRELGRDRGWRPEEQEVESLVARKAQVFDEVVERTEVLFPGAVECVRRLADDFPLGIASGALRHEIEMILARAGLDRHIRFIVASGDTPNSKPAPDPYARAAQLHGLPPSECVAIEDSRWGIESAKTAGLKCVGIATTYAAPQLSSADRVISSLDEFTADLIRAL